MCRWTWSFQSWGWDRHPRAGNQAKGEDCIVHPVLLTILYQEVETASIAAKESRVRHNKAARSCQVCAAVEKAAFCSACAAKPVLARCFGADGPTGIEWRENWCRNRYRRRYLWTVQPWLYRKNTQTWQEASWSEPCENRLPSCSEEENCWIKRSKSKTVADKKYHSARHKCSSRSIGDIAITFEGPKQLPRLNCGHNFTVSAVAYFVRDSVDAWPTHTLVIQERSLTAAFKY